MIFKNNEVFSSEVIKSGGENVLYINFLGADFIPSLEDYPDVMAKVVDIVAQNPDVSRMIFVQNKNYSFSQEQVNMLLEISYFYDFFVNKEKVFSSEKLSAFKDPNLVFSFLSNFFLVLLKQDPVFAYLSLKEEIIKNENYDNVYVAFLEAILNRFENLSLIKKAKYFLESGNFSGRKIYSKLLKPEIIPNFVFTKIVSTIPEDVQIIDEYKIGKNFDESLVSILRDKKSARFIYHLRAPEYSLKDSYQSLLDLAKNVLSEHKPTGEEFNDFERTRRIFFNVSKDLLRDLSSSRGIEISYEDLDLLASILVRHTIGFGVLEILLQDEKIQDIMINSPVSSSPIFIKHNDFDECSSNIFVSSEDIESWASKFRMLSGRPLDEAHPILDAALNLSNFSARVAIVQRPLSLHGLSYSLRRHRDNPWTLPLFIKNKTLNSLAAGLLSFLVDGGRTLLIAGTRSSGKTSLLGSLLFEIMPKYRIISVEDTPELPLETMRKIGYDVLSMKVRSALTGESNEVSAEEGIRASLRLGDSALIVGEIRSDEARALYEAMRIGALANVVAGTIHGASPYAVFDRVVNDLNVPTTSFKATDCIIIVNPIKSPDGIRSWRRVLQISEVRKHWTKDPLDEGGFVDLMKYDVEKDLILPSDDLINGDSDVIKSIASNVKGWAGDWDAVWDNIFLRQKIKEEIVSYSEKINKPSILEAEFCFKANNAFHLISEKVREDIGIPLSENVFPEWQEWLKKEAKRF